MIGTGYCGTYERVQLGLVQPVGDVLGVLPPIFHSNQFYSCDRCQRSGILKVKFALDKSCPARDAIADTESCRKIRMALRLQVKSEDEKQD